MPGNRFALLVSTSTYEDPNLRALRAPHKDAAKLAAVLRQSDIGGFEVMLVPNRDSGDVMQEIEHFFKRRSPDDVLLLYFSGHGIKDDAGSLYIATRNTKRELLRSTSVTDVFLRGVMRDSLARSQVLILDVCYGGAFSRELLAKGDDKVDVIDRFQGSGTVVLTASNEMEFAYEANAMKGKPRLSVFTKALIEGLRTGEADEDRDNKVSVQDLYRYAFKQVALARTGQTPTISSIGQEGSIFIADVPEAARTHMVPRKIPGAESVNLSRWVRTNPADKQLQVAVIAMETSLAYKGNWLQLNHQDFLHKLDAQASYLRSPSKNHVKDEPIPYTHSDLIHVLTKDGIVSLDGTTICRATITRLRSQSEIVGALKQGHPVIVGLMVRKAFFDHEVSTFGSLPEELNRSESMGGMTLGIFGYNADTARWLLLSPWPSWGLGGFGYMPVDQLPVDSSTDISSIDATVLGGASP